jgi:Animal haem peroxidase
MTLSRVLSRLAELLDRWFRWWRLPLPIGVLVLIGLRNQLREHNLYSTGRGPNDVPPDQDPNVANRFDARMGNGTFNDLEDPLMGAMLSRFGRNVPPEHTYPEEKAQLLDPNPRLISRHLLARDVFKPATTLNLLAAAWIQFEVHDWLSHPPTPTSKPWLIPLEKSDDWPEKTPDNEMKILRTAPDPSPDPDGPPTFVNQDTHWWDASQIYGDTLDFATALRTKVGGKLKTDEYGLPPADVQKLLNVKTGVAGNFWMGLALLHSLFIREHNAICDTLAATYHGMSDQELYDTARLVNTALMAKIHTIEWTPAIIAHPTTVFAMRTNWYGLLGERFAGRVGRISSNEVIGGIPGSPTNHHGVPYSLTEEFVAVYRMHPLIPDEFVFRSLEDNRVLHTFQFNELTVEHVPTRLSQVSLPDLFYSFGRSHPGALTLHNYPNGLRDFKKADGTQVDLAAIDVLRVRERGVPRYNEFRRLFRLKPASSFEELAGDDDIAEELRQMYGDVERVDLLVGLYAEAKPEGFGFSDTAFRVFILMASRRLESDRFFTDYFRPDVYTPVGFDWVKRNTLRDVLLRHHPELAPALSGVTNPFAPWRLPR